MTRAPGSLSLIVPFHRDVSQLRACLEALATSARGLRNVAAELLVAADGAPDDPADVARAFGARVVVVPGPSGPATARNRAAAEATGEVLVFVDSDVVVHADALTRIVSLLHERREVTAVFGAYDERPAAQGLVSQAKNLAHTFVHQGSAGNAVTFWAGLGAVRAEAFWQVGGFDERFRRPSIEDIDLGYRLTGAGHRIVIDPSISGTHLKHWTARSALASDLRDRGIPWTQLIPRYGGLQTTLNLAHRYRLCVVLAYVVAVGACAALPWPGTWPVPVVSLLAMLGLDSDYFLFMARCRGWWFAARTVPLRLGHHLANGVSFAVGNLLYLARRLGVRLPGSLPLDPWTADLQVRGRAISPNPPPACRSSTRQADP